MAQTKLEIINGALSRLGAEPISSDLLTVAETEFGEGEGGIQDGLSTDFDEIAAAAISVYPQARTHVLVAHDWSFLAHRSMLQQIVEPRAPWWPHQYRYDMPRNVLHNIRAVYRDPGGGDAVNLVQSGWSVLSGSVFADWTPAYADYQQSDLAEEAMPALVTLAIQADFTARMVVPVGNDIELKAGFERDAYDALMNAMRVDVQTYAVQALTGFGYLDAHYAGGYGGTI